METEVAVTKSFRELVQRRIAGDPTFAENLLREGIEAILVGDIKTGGSILRNHFKSQSDK